MVGGDIEHAGRLRGEGVNAFELGAADFGDDDVLGGGETRGIREGVLGVATARDVPRQPGAAAAGAHELPGENGDRALAVGAGDGHHGGFGNAEREFDFAPHRLARAIGGQDGRVLRREPRTDHQDIVFVVGQPPKPSGDDFHTQRPQGIQVPERSRALGHAFVIDHGRPALLDGGAGHRDPANPKTEHGQPHQASPGVACGAGSTGLTLSAAHCDQRHGLRTRMRSKPAARYGA